MEVPQRSPETLYVYLDINEKIEQDFFKSPGLFFKIVNLHKKKPLVQLGSFLFHGVYEDTVGTKVFLKETEEHDDDSNGFAKKTPIKLQYLTKTFKCINLKYLKISEEISQVEPNDLLVLNLQQDYKETLRKYKENALNIAELVIGSVGEIEANEKKKNLPKKTGNNETDEQVLEKSTANKTHFQQASTTIKPAKSKTKNNTNDVFQLLNDAIKIPAKQMKHPEKTLEGKQIEPKNSKNFLILKQLYLQSLTYKDVYHKVNVEDINEYVDIKSSMDEGIIESRDIDGMKLTEDEKNKLISMQNIHNLCVPLQLTFLIEQLRLEKENISLLSDDEKEVIDDYGRTPKERYRLLKTFAKDVWYQLFVRLSEK